MPKRDSRSNSQAKTCSTKLTFATKELAEAAIAYARWQYGDSSTNSPITYNCSECHKWHLARRRD